jgi:tRNA modification GTPase
MLDTIVALATAPMKAALAIVRLSGEDVFGIVSKVFSKDITTTKEKSIFVGDIVDGDKTIDQVVLLVYVCPHSFTGENAVEIICHGSIIIAQEIISLLIKNGARYALNGEFSNRAFLNKKIDLIQAEAINDAINATTSEAKNLAILSLKGKTSQLVTPIKDKLADILSLIEVNVDYPEYYDVEIATKEKIETEITAILKLLRITISNGYKGNIIKDGITIAIVGKPNAGKSTLLNAFLKEKKAIVTDIPGTTRDVVEGQISLNGVSINLLDTAGIRESSDIIEKEGIERSKEAIGKADLILYVLDSSDKDEDKELVNLVKNKKCIKVYNKTDLNDVKADGVHISAITGDIETVKDAIIRSLNLKEDNYVNPSINNIREIGILEQIANDLEEALKSNSEKQPLDIISVPLNDAYQKTLELLGESADLDITKEIFSRFCIGK